MKKFEEVNNAYSYAKELCARTFDVYKALKEMNKPSRPKDVANHMKFFLYEDISYQTPNTAKVVHPLYWLKEMGLADYEEREEIVEYKLDFGFWETVTKTDSNGIVWRREKWNDASEPIKRLVKIKYWYTIA